MEMIAGKFRLTKLFLWAFLALGCSGQQDEPALLKFYVGSSDGRLEHAIFLCEFNPSSGSFAVLDSFTGARGASYLDFAPDGKTLYAVNGEGFPGDPGHMSVTSFRIDPETHALTLLNSQSSQGSGPCHVHVSPDGKTLFAANYNSGHAAAFPLAEDGLISPATAVVRGEGSGPVAGRQNGPHAHQVMMDPSGKFLLVPDLGADKVLIYAFESETGQLIPNPGQPFLQMPPGAGPRHLAFDPSGKFIWLVSELNASVTACRFNQETGGLSVINTASVVDSTFTGNKQSAAIRVHPNGKFVYASNRSDRGNLAVFRIKENGSVKRIQVVEEVPFWPREFNIDPSGRYLMVAGERSNKIELYQIDRVSGTLSATGISMGIRAPACILFIVPGDQNNLTTP
jgi:6-phosphogluconolactonase